MLTLASPVLLAKMLWALLLLDASFSAQKGSKSQGPTLSAGGVQWGQGRDGGSRLSSGPGGAEAPGNVNNPRAGSL